jgi:cytochrome P450
MAVADPPTQSAGPDRDAPPRYGLPPGPQLPRLVSTALFLGAAMPMMRALQRRHGDMYSVDVPVFGRSVVKQVFQARPDVLAFGERSPLGRVLGPGSLFALDGEAHLRERRLILPAFHGERMRSYEPIIEQETRRELGCWSPGVELATLPSFMRITLGAILRTVFGADAAQVRELAEVLPPFVTLGSRLALAPWLQRDYGPGSPGPRFASLRARYDAIVGRLIDARRADPSLQEREDILSLLLQAHYEDGAEMSRSAIADELLTLLAAGHETTATSLAWAVERLRRNPGVLRRLTEEARGGDERTLRMAAIHEVQRVRPVISATSRQTLADFPLGNRIIPRGHQIIVAIWQIHHDPRFFADPERFSPERFLDAAPDTYTWVPFGGGTRRCPGAAFAHMEMDIVLRTLLREFDLEPTDRRGERLRDRGIANAPARGGRAVVRRAG